MDSERQNVSGSVPTFGAIMTMSALAMGNISAATPMQASAKEAAQSSITTPVYLLEQYASAVSKRPEITTSDCKRDTDVELEIIFNGLTKIWKDATGGLSVTSRRFSHPTYRAILRLGPETIPFILKELQKRPDWWFDALEHLTNENPTKPTDSFEQAVVAWIEWGKKHKLVR